ncbi:ribonuclease H family protein [Aquibacillus sp. 3ASR75-11]|uniref:Ribonuclease H family protein n=1 Tax=Terrihalobacillus insolitus TaxID=2950438 RepID=A0A9X4AQ24_9BACI|nr:ribonuclease H family protein [Terrihalobacillus insolitus]MDC3413526.1 ribonuclease H family protein [Terrihalobacillus insolitus]MDC3426188.1 ribonuclease H family protein [Terrihalobacillus insolitus]
MNVKMEVSYQTPKGTQTTLNSDEMRVGKAILIAEDLERTGRAKNVTFIDSHENTWTLKELKIYMKGIQTEPHNVTVYFDGGFDLKTKRSGLGCTIYYEQNGKSFRLRKNALVEELDTNNEAEYAAFHLGLQELDLLGVHHLPVTFVGDSQVVINQLNGEWPCLEEELSKWADRIENKLDQLGIHPHYQFVSRKRNREADQLAAQALKEIEITSTIEIPLDE